MDGWTSTSIGRIATFNYGKSLPADSRIPGSVPVYGSNGIVGWHNRAIVNSPGIIVGRKGTVGAVQYSPVPFCPIDTTYFITQDDSSADLRFLAYLLQHAQLSRLVSDLVPGLNRDSALASVVSIPSDYAEQQQIAAVLSAVQRSGERQERLMALTTELKKALMHKLFTEGIRGEPLKQTEIGTVPVSWTVTPLEDVSEAPQYGFTASAKVAGDARMLRITDIQDASVNWSAVPFCDCPPNELGKYQLRTGDLVFARIGATTGKNFLVIDPPERAVFASYLIRVRPRNGLHPQFLAYFCQSAPYWRQIAASKGNNLKGGFNSSLLRRMLIPLPKHVEEQERIAETLAALDRKIGIARRSWDVLNAGFRTLLDQFMSAQISVRDLDLSTLDTEMVKLAGVV